MHELSVVKALIDSLQPWRDKTKYNSIAGVVIEVGDMTCVDSERLRFCFDMVKSEAGLDKARLRIRHKKAMALCRQCGEQFHLLRPGDACACGSFDYQLLTGEELNLTEVELN